MTTQGFRIPDKIPFKPPVPKVIQSAKCRTFANQGSKSFFKALFGPFCVRFNQKELLELLRKVGDFNPRYMAVTRDAAANFSDLTRNFQDLPTQDKRSNWHRDENDGDTEDPKEILGKRSIPDQPGTILRGCLNKGSLVGRSNFRRMCSECAATTQLDTNVFPPFINEIVCHEIDRSCSPLVGRCSQGVLKFTFIRSTGNYVRDKTLSNLLRSDVYFEEWQEFTQNIRSCCDCLSFSSPLG